MCQTCLKKPSISLGKLGTRAFPSWGRDNFGFQSDELSTDCTTYEECVVFFAGTANGGMCIFGKCIFNFLLRQYVHLNSSK